MAHCLVPQRAAHYSIVQGSLRRVLMGVQGLRLRIKVGVRNRDTDRSLRGVCIGAPGIVFGGLRGDSGDPGAFACLSLSHSATASLCGDWTYRFTRALTLSCSLYARAGAACSVRHNWF